MSGLFFTASSVQSPPIANITTVLDALRVVVRPVHKAAQVIPLIHAANLYAIA